MSSDIRARGRGRGRTSRINTVTILNSVEPVSGVMTRNQRRLFLLEQEVGQTDNSNQFDQTTRNNRRSSIDSVYSIPISNESNSFTSSSNGTNYPCQDLGNIYAISTEDQRKYDQIIQRSLENHFDTKKIKIGNRIKEYTPILNFSVSKLVLDANLIYLFICFLYRATAPSE